MDEIKISIYGRGGQGAKTCAQIIAEGGMESKNYIKAFPEYGPERRGAPVKAFVRISKKAIRVNEPIKDPDVVLVIDGNLANVLKEIRDYKCPVIVNTNKDLRDFKSKEVYFVDGTKISLEEIKINNPNIVLIGCLLKLLKEKKIDIIKYKDIEKIIKKTFSKKGKEHLIEPNINCLKKGFESL